MITVELSRPIQAHGETRKTIELREPSGVDIKACGGNPGAGVSTDNGTMFMINPHVVAAYISRLGSIPPSSVDQLSAPDWMRCQNAVTGFFNEPEVEEATSSNGILTSATSGNGALERSSN